MDHGDAEQQQGYEDDFDEADEGYLDDFEEEDNDDQQQHHASPGATTQASYALGTDQRVSVVDTHAWPSLGSTAVPAAAPAARQFARPLFLPAAAQQENHSATIIEQPLPPPLSLKQRRQAASALTRAHELAAQHTLALSTQLELLVVPQLSLQDQFARGMGVFAGRAVPAACQTRQLNRDVYEQDAQTDDVDTRASSCQVPEDLHTSQRHAAGRSSGSGKQPVRHTSRAGSEFASFVEWAAPQMLHELSRAGCTARESEVAGLSFAPTQTVAGAQGSLASAASSSPPLLLVGEMLLNHNQLLAGRSVVGLCGPATRSDAVAAAAAINTGSSASAPTSFNLLLTCCSPVALEPPDAAVKTHGLPALGCACVWALASDSPAASCSSPRLLQLLVTEGSPTCCCWGVGGASGLVFAGLEDGSICVWDLAEPESMHPREPITDGDGTESPEQQCQGGGGSVAARRPAYTAGVPTQLFEGLQSSSAADASADGGVDLGWLDGIDSVAAVAALPLSGSGTFADGCAVACGGPVCQLLVAASNGCLSLFTVLMGPAGSDAAVGNLGMRSGSRVWMVRMVAGLALGCDLAKPLHLRLRQPSVGNASSTTAITTPTFISKTSSSRHSTSLLESLQVSSLLVLPGPGKQLLVGVGGGRILKASCLAPTSPPYELVAQQWQQPPGSWCGPAAADTAAIADANSSSTAAAAFGPSALLGAVLSLSVCSSVPDACLAALACGKVALFSTARSRPVLVWHHPLGHPVLAVRWLPSQAGAFVALCAGAAADAPGSLLAFDVARSTKAPLASALLARGAAQPRCLEVLVTSNGSSWVPVGTQHSSPPAGSSTQGTTAQVPVDVGVVVGFDDGSSSMFQLAQGWAEGRLPLHSSCSERTQTHAEQVKRLQELLVQ